MANLLQWSGKFARATFLLALAGSLTHLAAQRITILDFSSASTKPRKHPPKPFPPGTMLGGRAGGMTSGKLIVSLVSMDKTEYSVGDDFSYVLEVRTAGAETVRVPTLFNVADLEPDDPNVSFNFEAIEIWIGFAEKSNERSLSVPLLRLYGSDEMPWTEIELKPGMFIEVRGKAKVKRLDPDPKRRVDSAGQFFDAPYMWTSEDLPEGELRVLASCWRGDKFHYDGRTHYEYPGSFLPEETSRSVFPGKITLLPESEH